MKKDCYVYVLKDVTGGNKVFYVGRGTIRKGTFGRYKDHVRDARKGCSLYVHRKMRSIWNSGGDVNFDIVATGLTFEESNRMEKELILSYGRDNLTNLSDGGDDCNYSGKRKTKQVFMTGENGEVLTFESGAKAAEFMGVSVGQISKAVRRSKWRGYRVCH